MAAIDNATSSGQRISSKSPADIPGALKIINTDWNGRTFDGSPFRGEPAWLQDVITSGAINISDVTDRDYAVFDVVTAGGVVRAFPGDQITLESDGFLRIHPHPESLSDPARLPRST